MNILNLNSYFPKKQEMFSQVGRCNIAWDSYPDYVKEMLQNMLEDEFTDVTLVSDDQKEIKAHKSVLSSCSSVFKKILSGNKTFNPIIYLRGIKYQELESIVQFIYNGQTSCAEAGVKEFLDVARNLEIKELSGSFDDREVENVDEAKEVRKKDPFIYKHNEEKVNKTITDSKETTKERPDILKNKMMLRCPSLQCDEMFESKKALQVHHDSNHKPKTSASNGQDKNLNVGKNKGKPVEIKPQEYFDVVKVVETITNYACFLCQYKLPSKENLKSHMLSEHKQFLTTKS